MYRYIYVLRENTSFVLFLESVVEYCSNTLGSDARLISARVPLISMMTVPPLGSIIEDRLHFNESFRAEVRKDVFHFDTPARSYAISAVANPVDGRRIGLL